MLQYKIPSDVEIEDKILGPLTLRQLIIAAIGGGISYTLFLIASESFELGLVDYVFIGIPFLLSLAFAFLRINDVSFLKWLLLLGEFLHNSRRRKWDKVQTSRLHYAFVTAKAGGQDAADKKVVDDKKRDDKKKLENPGRKKFSSLEEITHLLDHRSPYSEEEKHLETDHTDDHGLTLTAAEKDRHEARLEGSIADHKPLTVTPPSSASTQTSEHVAQTVQNQVQKQNEAPPIQ